MKNLSFPKDAPFSQDQKSWLAGFAAGLNSQLIAHRAIPNEEQQKLRPLSVLYGTQTGNAEMIAQDVCDAASRVGFAPKNIELDSISIDSLQEVSHALFIVSTYGVGEMPDNAQLFWEALSASTAPRLENLKYGVLGLGDTSYDDFCEAGKLLDMRLEQLGASRLSERIDCDVEYEDPANAWISSVLESLKGDSSEYIEMHPNKPRALENKKPLWTRKNPYQAKIQENSLLTTHDSSKEVRHIVLGLRDSGLDYLPGDALNVLPRNHSSLVSLILEDLKAKYDAPVDEFDEPLGDVLKNRLEIVTPSKDLIAEISERSNSSDLKKALQNNDKSASHKRLWGVDILDLLKMYPAKFSPTEFVKLLRPLQHRAYSISSSLRKHPEQVHLTVAAVRWRHNDREHRGVASTWLADGLDLGDKANVFFTRNKNFRLPGDNDRPIIMVGPGTGIAPFRAFLHEREALGATGKNWLFFGDRRRDQDFLYKDEIENWSKKNHLSNLDLAFSRDQGKKDYVQHRMIEKGKELFKWLEEGAIFYICGDAERMAVDVEAALHSIVETEGDLTVEASKGYVNKLKKDKRFLRDVY
ncbi:MAG: sulfite reductase subunit alpha [Gammaproteobacteria bacterium]|nr:sulfite reductase subunit alpha [Gammaproteobacteria bacterium]